MARAAGQVRWIERLDQVRTGGQAEEPVVWIARHDDLAQSLPPAEDADLADAASARREGGGGRVLRRRLLRALAARAFDVHPAEVRFTRTACGAPGLLGLPGFVSAAGCAVEGKGWSAVALSSRRVGVDLEPASAADARWVLTEAYLKGAGFGLLLPPERIRIAPDDAPGAWRLHATEAGAAQGEVRMRPPVMAAAALWPPLVTLGEEGDGQGAVPSSDLPGR